MSSETHDIGPAEVNTQKIALIGIGGALATFFLIVLTQFFFYFVVAKVDSTKGLADPVKQAGDGSAAQRMKLDDGGRWVKKEADLAAVPIGVAMDLVLAGKRAKAPPAPPAPTPPATPPAAKTEPMPKAPPAAATPMPKAKSSAEPKG